MRPVRTAEPACVPEMIMHTARNVIPVRPVLVMNIAKNVNFVFPAHRIMNVTALTAVTA